MDVSPDRDGVAWDEDGSAPDLRALVHCDSQVVETFASPDHASVDMPLERGCLFATQEDLLAAVVTVGVDEVDLDSKFTVVERTVVRVMEEDVTRGTKHVERLGQMQGLDLGLAVDGEVVKYSVQGVVVDDTNMGAAWDDDGTGPDVLASLDCAYPVYVEPAPGALQTNVWTICTEVRSELLAKGIAFRVVEDDSLTQLVKDLPVTLTQDVFNKDGMAFAGTGHLTGFRFVAGTVELGCE